MNAMFGGSSVLHVIATYQDDEVQEEAVRTLLGRGASVDAKDAEGYTPLCIAARQGKPKVFELLLDSASEMTFKNGDSLMHMAVSSREPGCIKCISLVLSKWPHLKDEPNKRGLTPVHQCAYSQNVECLVALIKEGANIHKVDNNGCDTLL